MRALLRKILTFFNKRKFNLEPITLWVTVSVDEKQVETLGFSKALNDEEVKSLEQYLRLKWPEPKASELELVTKQLPGQYKIEIVTRGEEWIRNYSSNAPTHGQDPHGMKRI